MLDVTRNTSRNMIATWVAWVLCQGEEGGGPLMLDVARNMTHNGSQHAHNMSHCTFRSDG
jgi:hypothetical protein